MRSERGRAALVAILFAGLACAGPGSEAPPPPVPAAPAPAAPAPAPEPPWPCRTEGLPTDRAPDWTYEEMQDTPHVGTPPRAQGEFERFVTPAGVVLGVVGAVGQLGRWDPNDRWGIDPAYVARSEAYRALVPSCEAPPGCPEGYEHPPLQFAADETGWLWRRSVVSEARRHLSDPERLWHTWQVHRESVIETVASADGGPPLRAFLRDEVLPALRTPIGADLCAALDERNRLWLRVVTEQGSEEDVAAWRETADQVKALTPYNIGVVEFVNRRGMEGGPGLVRAWLRVLEDLDRGLADRGF